MLSVLDSIYNHCSRGLVKVKDDFVSMGRSVSDLKAHLVLTAKYRRKVFTGDMLSNDTRSAYGTLCKIHPDTHRNECGASFALS